MNNCRAPGTYPTSKEYGVSLLSHHPKDLNQHWSKIEIPETVPSALHIAGIDYRMAGAVTDFTLYTYNLGRGGVKLDNTVPLEATDKPMSIYRPTTPGQGTLVAIAPTPQTNSLDNFIIHPSSRSHLSQ